MNLKIMRQTNNGIYNSVDLINLTANECVHLVTGLKLTKRSIEHMIHIVIILVDIFTPIFRNYKSID